MSLNLRNREIFRKNSSLVFSSTPVREPHLNKSRSTGDINSSARQDHPSTYSGSSDCFKSTETVRSFDVSPGKVDCRPVWVGQGLSQTGAFMSQLTMESLKKENLEMVEEIQKLGKTVSEQKCELESLRLTVIRLTEELSQSEGTIHRLQDDLTAACGTKKPSTRSLDDVAAKLDSLCEYVHMLSNNIGLSSNTDEPSKAKKLTVDFQTVSSRKSNKRPSKLPLSPKSQVEVQNFFQPLVESISEQKLQEEQPQMVSQTKRKKKKNKKKKKKQKIIVLGDSQARDMSWHLKNILPEREVVSFVRPGMPLSMVLHGLEDLVKKEKFSKSDHLVIMGGTNDFHKKNNAIVSNEDINRVRKVSRTTNVIMVPTPLTFDRGSDTRDGIRKFNQEINRQLLGSGVISLPLDFGRKDLMPDRLHLSANAKRILSRQIFNSIHQCKPALPTPRPASNEDFLGLNILKETMV